MKASFVLAALFLTAAPAVATGADVQQKENPLGMVISLLTELAAKVTKEGEDEAKAYHDYFEWCDDASRNFGFDINDATNKKEKLEAQIAKLGDDSEAAAGKIEELAANI